MRQTEVMGSLLSECQHVPKALVVKGLPSSSCSSIWEGIRGSKDEG